MNITDWDHWFIKTWHTGFHPDVLDYIVPIWREKKTWIPFYIILAIYLIYKYKLTGLYVILGAITAVALGDQLAASVLKPFFERTRPCNVTELQPFLDVLVPCGSSYSFPSNHATNHFALATFLSFSIFNSNTSIKITLWAWAATISLGQVYVAKHFFSDVLAGAIIGGLIGLCCAVLLNKLLKRNLNNTNR